MTEPTHSAAVIFDVDGPLLDLTGPEEDAFFVPFERLYGLTGLSRDWDSYRVRNDEDILREILERHHGRPATEAELAEIAAEYARELADGFRDGRLAVTPIPGAAALIDALRLMPGLALGIATANLRSAAEIRLREAGLWEPLSAWPGTADGGGPKRDVLARVMAGLRLPPERVVFIGDNLNDLDAGLANRTHFIGFHIDEPRRRRLADHGARHVAGDHADTFGLIRAMLSL